MPVLLDGIRLDLLQLVTTLNEIGGRHGVGRVDLVENRGGRVVRPGVHLLSFGARREHVLGLLAEDLEDL